MFNTVTVEHICLFATCIGNIEFCILIICYFSFQPTGSQIRKETTTRAFFVFATSTRQISSKLIKKQKDKNKQTLMQLLNNPMSIDPLLVTDCVKEEAGPLHQL